MTAPAGRSSIERMSTRALLALLLAALLLSASAADAARRPRLPTTANFVLQSATVEADLDWRYQDNAETGRCNSYVIARGDQRISFKAARATPYQLLRLGRSASLSPVELARFEGEVARTADWRPHASECGVCGGELGDCEGPVQQPPAASFDCRRRALRSPQLVVVLVPKQTAPDFADRDYVSLEASANEPAFRNCPPTQPGGPGLPARPFNAIPVEGSEYQRLLTARPGRTVALAGTSSHGYRIPLSGPDGKGGYLNRCPPLSGPGQQICVRQSIRAVFKRVR
jgi:hypothetical protein